MSAHNLKFTLLFLWFTALYYYSMFGISLGYLDDTWLNRINIGVSIFFAICSILNIKEDG